MRMKLFYSQARFGKTPHVCFATSQSFAEAKRVLPGLLESHFRSRFTSFRFVKTWLSGPWAGVIQTERSSHSMVLGKNRHGTKEWILVVFPPRVPSLLDRLLKRRIVSDVEDVKAVCREIHALLTTFEGLFVIRWYFEGPRSQSAAVSTPDELPWDLEGARAA